jgi:hypothetical protein
MKIDPSEISKIQEALNDIPSWELEVFNVWESTKGQLKITIRLGRK